MDNLLFSSSDVDEEAVEELLAQILDEELLRITTTPAAKPGPLDPELEARYQKLKASVVSNPRRNFEKKTDPQVSFSKRSLDSNSGRSSGDSNSSPRERKSFGDSQGRTYMSRSVSPPPPRSCFCGSPKKLLRSLSSRKSHRKSDRSRFSAKKSVDIEVKGGKLEDELDGISDEEFLTDLSTFSLKSQQKKLNKALSEEEKVNREAEELVEWVKQASARMDVSISDYSPSDEEELKR